ncbi:MAG: ABC transporter substrate-binding protein [Rhizobiaceae bacterium]|nr:ABC transporter substrate-binding protein [Rhizobiaceae bacterium]
MRIIVPLFTLAAALVGLIAAPASAEPKHGIAMHGEPLLPADFTHLPYANPDAPKGGRIDYAWPGTFDSVNPFIVQGSAARGSVDLVFGDLVFDRLMIRAQDEPFTLYPLLAKTVETDDARSFVEFTLDERAKFSDGQPVTPDDVIFTIELLRDKGLPRYGVTAKKIETMEKVGERGVRLTFKQPDRELPLILGSLPILPKHAINAETFDKSTLTPMIGSGPYRLDRVKAGELLVFKRNPDYWAKDIPSKRGVDNYDEVRLSYFRDDNALFEAFKKGLVDVFIDDNSGRWADGYNFAAVADGRVVKETFPTKTPSGMFSIVMNSRRSIFADRATREALTSLFDFEWANRTLLSGAYTRTKSFYDNSELSSYGRPASEAEKALLADFPDAVTPEILATGWQPPTSDGTGRDRAFLKAGLDKLNAAGFKIDGGKLLGPDGKPLSFEIMLKAKENEQLAIAWQQTLARVGIDVTIRSVDAAQFLERQVNYDFDAMFFNYSSSLSPGVEQVARWGSAARDTPGTFNYAGVANPAVDALIDRLINARSREDFVEAVRAYDRVLLSGAYVLPLYFRPEQWVARWSHIKRPDVTPIYGFQLPTWWRED